MDFHAMKRKELQALCKKHSIPANLTNLEMANKLTSLLKENERPKTRGRSCLKGLDEIVSVDDSDVVSRPKKKVKFSPENEMFEYSKSVPREKRRMARRNPKRLAVQNVDRFESNEEFVENPVRVTRSRTHSLIEDDLVSIMNHPVEKKRGRKPFRKVVDLYDDSVDEETKLPTRRLLRNREVVDSGVVSVQNPLGKRGRKRGIDRIDEPQSSVVVLSENSDAEEQARMPIGRSLRNRKVAGNSKLLSGNLGKTEIAGRQKIPRSNAATVKSRTVVETEIEVQKEDDVVLKEPLRRSGRNRKSLMPRVVNKDKSQRNGKKSEESEILNGDDMGKVEPGSGKITGARAQFGVKVSAVVSKSITETESGFERGIEVLNIEEPLRQTGRNNNRRKSIIPQATDEDKVGVPQLEAPPIRKVGVPQLEPPPTRNFYRHKAVLPQVEKVKADGPLTKYNRRSRARKQVSFEDEKAYNIMDDDLVEISASKSVSLQTENREQEMEISVKENLNTSPEVDIEKSVQDCGTKEVDHDLLSNSPQNTGEKYRSNSSSGSGKVKDLNGADVARFAPANSGGDGSLDQMDSTVEPKGTQTEKELEGLNGIDEPAMHESVIRNCLEVSNESRDSKKYDGNVCESPREATSYDLIEEVRITAIRQENMEVENTEIFVESGEPNEPNFQKRIQHTDVDDSSTNKILTIEEPIAPNAVILSLPEECGPVDQVKEGKMTAQFLNSNGDANCCEEAFTAPLSGTFCISHDIGGNNDKMEALVPQELSSCKQTLLKYAENDDACQSKNSDSAPDDRKEIIMSYSSNKEISATEMSKEREFDDIKDSADNAQASLLVNSKAFEGNVENESSSCSLGCVGLAPLEQKIVLEDQEANDSAAIHVCQTGMLELQTTKYGEISPIMENLECDANIRIYSEEITEEAVITTEKEHQSSEFVDTGLSCHKHTSLDGKDEIEECVNLNNLLGTPVNSTYTNKGKTSSQDILMYVDEDNKMEALVPQELSSCKQTLLKYAENDDGCQSKNRESAPDDCKCSSVSYSSNKENSATEMSKEREIDVIKDSADNAQASLVVNSEDLEVNIENEPSACSLGCVGLAPLEPKIVFEDQEANDSGTVNVCQTGKLELQTMKYAEISPVRDNLECGANIRISSEEITEEAVITTDKDLQSSLFVDIGLSCHRHTSLEVKDESEECVNLNNLLRTPVNSTHANKEKTSSHDILMSVDEDNKMVKEESESEHENNIPMATTDKENIDKSSSEKEQEYQLNHLFAFPFGRSNPCEQEASSHEKLADVAMSLDRTTSMIRSRDLSAVEPQEIEGVKANEHERSIRKRNVIPPADEELNDDGNHERLTSEFWNSNGDNNGSNMTMQYPSNTTEEAITSPLSGTDCFLQDIGGNNDKNKVLVLQDLSSCKQTVLKDAAAYPASKDDICFVNMEQYLVELAEFDEGCQSKNGESAPDDSIETSVYDSSNKEREIFDIKHSVDTAQASHVVNAKTFAGNKGNSICRTDGLLHDLEVQDVAMEVVVPEELSLRKQTRLIDAVVHGIGEENKVFVKAEHNLVELAKIDEGCQLKDCEGASDNSIKTTVLDFANGERSAKHISQEGENDHARDSIKNAAVMERAEISHVLSNQGDELANEVEERPDFRTSFVVSEDVKDKIITHESSVGDLSAQINSEDSDNERAENLNIFVVALDCKTSVSVDISISSYLHSALKGREETEQVKEIAVSMDKDNKKVQNERFNQGESEEMVGADESEPKKELQMPTTCGEDTNEGSAENEQECHLNLLFATPVSRENPYKEEKSSHEKIIDGRMSLDKNDSKVESGEFSCGERQEIVEPKVNGHERSIHKGNTTPTADERLDEDKFKILSSTPVSNKINKESDSYGLEEISDVALTVEKTNNKVGHSDTQEMLRGETTFDCDPKENWQEEDLKNRFATPVSDDNSVEVSNEKLRSAVMEAIFYNEDAKDVITEVNNEAILKSNELGSCEGEETFVQIPSKFEGTKRQDEVDCDVFAGQGKEIILEQGGDLSWDKLVSGDCEVEISKKVSVEGSLCNLKNNELGLCESENNKVVVGPEMDLGVSTSSETVEDREGEEDFVQISANVEGTMQQVDEVDFDGQGKELILEQGGDLSSDKVILGDCEVEISKNMSVEGCLSIVKSNDLQEKRDYSYQLQVSAQGLDGQLENDKAVKIDNFSQSSVPYREEEEEEPNQFGDLNVHSKGKDITEVLDYELNEFKRDKEEEPNAQGEMTEVLEDNLNEFQEDKEVEQEPQEYDGGPNVDAQVKEMAEVPDNDINEFEGDDLGIAAEDVKIGGSLVRRENQATEAEEGTSQSTKRFYSTTMKTKTMRTNLIRRTPSKLFVDMKENAQSLKREPHSENINAAKSVTKRRALGQL